MNKNLLFRVIAVTLTVVLMCSMGGCATASPAPTQQAISVPCGMLLLSTDAVMEIQYDTAGKVTALTGANKQGLTVAETCTDLTGKDCATAVGELIKASADNGCLPESVKTVVLKQMLGSRSPKDGFMEDLATQVQNALDTAGSTAKVITVSTEQLDERGYIGPETVKALLQNHLGMEKLDKYSGVLENSNYSCAVVTDGAKHDYEVDANTGIVTKLTDPDSDDITVEGPDEDQGDTEETVTDPGSALELNVISFNIRCISSSDTGVKSWDQRAVPLAKYLMDLNADIICMQESGSQKQYNFLKDALRDTYDVYRGYDGRSAGNVVALRKNTFQILEKEVFWLSDTPEEYSIGWDGKNPRVCQYFKLQHNQTGIAFSVFNTHLDHVGINAPIHSMEMITQRIKNSNVPCILTGDMNEDETTQTYKIAMDVLKDTQKTAPTTDSGRTYNRWGKHPDTGPQVDFIWVSPSITPLSFRICRERWDGINYYSDHYAVQSVIRLTP